MEAQIEGTRVSAIEDFKRSKEMDRLKDEYPLGSYLNALKEARAFLRAKMPRVALE